MFSQISIHNFRGFKHLELEDLARVNLLVGANSSGKTAVLEAAQVLASDGDYRVLSQGAYRRGEIVSYPDERRGMYSDAPDLNHLFHGHRIQLGSEFSITGFDAVERQVTCRIIREKEQSQLPLAELNGAGDSSEVLGSDLSDVSLSGLSLQILSSRRADRNVIIPLILDDVRDARLRRELADDPRGAGVVFVTTEQLGTSRLATLWDNIALTKDEHLVIEALQILDPSIERIAFLSEPRRHRSSGIFVKKKGSDRRIPLGSLGDGLRRLLALSLSVINSAGGVLLVDEIDTGLHYTAMESMWRLVIETARRLSAQIFTTTHSQDCVRSLARLTERSEQLRSQVRLHRIEKGQAKTIAYSAAELMVAAKQNLEVR